MTPQTITTTETLALAIQTPLNRPKLGFIVRQWNPDTRKWVRITNNAIRAEIVNAVGVNSEWELGSSQTITLPGGRFIVEAY